MVEPIKDNVEECDFSYSIQPPTFGGERFDFQKDNFLSFFNSQQLDLWNTILEGYRTPINNVGKKNK